LLQAPDEPIPPCFADTLPADQREHALAELQRLREGVAELNPNKLPWDVLEPFIRLPHDDSYVALHKPKSWHGTGLAGIIAANWPEAAEVGVGEPLQGICPDIQLYDIRVLDENRGDESAILAALGFLLHLNGESDFMRVHGVNLGLTIPVDVQNFPAGYTPIDVACDRLVTSGMVVVAAAGNGGVSDIMTPLGPLKSHGLMNIGDPGNAENVITVGSTHRFMTDKWGVSYFSSRGPTIDGRMKPDLVAPGERIDVPGLDGEYEIMDGTSPAAAHVSGAAALLLSRYPHLIGRPLQVKKILCDTATDLGRDRYCQGHGMVDVLRALESV
jgi:subtilisin family serine protease